MRRNRANKTGRAIYGPPYVQLHWHLLDSPAWLRLSATARAAYIEVCRLYNGSNNGSLCLSSRRLAERLPCGKSHAARALIELEDAGFIDTVKMGFFAAKKKSSEYRLTQFKCDLSHAMPTKRYLSELSRSHQRDYSVPPAGQCAKKATSKPANSPTSGTNGSIPSPSNGTHISTKRVGVERGRASAPVGSAVASKPAPVNAEPRQLSAILATVLGGTQ